VLTYEGVFTTLFGIIMLPAVESRRKIADTLENLVDHLALYGDSNNINLNPLMNVYYSAEEEGWNVEDELVVGELVRRPFFCRFDAEMLL